MEIIFEFVGGSRDGQTEGFDTKARLKTRAHGFYWVTNEGKVGTRFCGLTEYAVERVMGADIEAVRQDSGVRGETYEVIERDESDGKVRVRCKFVGYGMQPASKDS